MGWYLMALVDTLPYVPEHDPHHAVLLAMLRRAAAAVERAQDPQSSLWYQILNKPGEKRNYIESSSVLMFTYAFAKGARLGYLPKPLRNCCGTRVEGRSVSFYPSLRHREK